MVNPEFERLRQYVGEAITCQQDDEQTLTLRTKHTDHILHTERFDPAFPYVFDETKVHIGHDIQCVMYGDVNVAIECKDCYTVIHDQDINSDDY